MFHAGVCRRHADPRRLYRSRTFDGAYLSQGFLELFCFVKDIYPVFLVDTLKTIANELLSNQDIAIESFQRSLNTVYSVGVRVSSHADHARGHELLDPRLSPSRFQRRPHRHRCPTWERGVGWTLGYFHAVSCLMRRTSVFDQVQSIIERGVKMMESTAMATPEVAKQMIPAAPADYMEALDQYETVEKEQGSFIGKPTRAMVMRWVATLLAIRGYLADTNPSSPLKADAESLAKAILDGFEKCSVCLQTGQTISWSISASIRTASSRR